jgi:hypothetical protein
MILIPLTGTCPLSNHVSYHVSPLYELAASLYTLAQIEPPEPFQEWTNEVIERFHTERILKDWEYVRPLFRYGIPDIFEPYQTQGVMAISELYEYFVTLTPEAFARSLQPSLEDWSLHHDHPAIAVDLQDDPDYVKGRFNLFLSSYWQLFFEATWEKIAPRFVREAERIQHACADLPSLLSYLRDISPAFSYQAEKSTLIYHTAGPELEAQQLILQPSQYIRTPSLSKEGTEAFLVYPLI